MKFDRDDEQGVFAIAEVAVNEYAAVQQVGANVLVKTTAPLGLSIYFDSNDDLDIAIKFGQAIIDAANAAKERRTT
jgi:hypothetical protein